MSTTPSTGINAPALLDRHSRRFSTHTLHVKNIPLAVWMKAKQNAVASDLSWRDYIIRLLDESRPFPQTKGPPLDV